MTSARAVTVAIDGPAGAGKSTVAKAVADALGYSLVDTGAIYRTVALLALEQGIAFDDDLGLKGIVDQLEIRFQMSDGDNEVIVETPQGRRHVSAAIRTPEVSRGASMVSARTVVRAGLLDLQRRLAGQGSAVLEGRDIGTVVFPEAEVKVFLTASAHERALRRFREMQDRGIPADFDEVLRDIQDRDAMDEGRSLAPLRAAPDAIRVDSTKMTVDEVVTAVRRAVAACSTPVAAESGC